MTNGPTYDSWPKTNPWPKTVAHADMDAFYAAAEQLDHPSLRGKPVLVGPRSRRGVVLTASYEARPFGVGSAMPMAEALRRCPQAVVAPPRFERYTELSTQIMAVFADFSPTVEPLSLDEAFIDMTGAEHIFGPPENMARQIKNAVYNATGLTISVGIAASKYVAKVASAYNKPNGLTVVPPEQAKDWLGALPISRLWGAGPKTQARMHQHGYQLIGDIAAADPMRLSEQLGSAGGHFFELAHARDPRHVQGHRVNRSMGSDRTLATDVSDPTEIKIHLRRSADRIARRLRYKHYLAGGVRVRLKTSSFKLLSRQCTLAQPSDTAEELYFAASSLISKFNHAGPFRLVGMAAHSLQRVGDQTQLDLLQTHQATRKLEVVLDEVTHKFGNNTFRRARDVNNKTLADSTPNLDFISSDESTTKQ